MVAILAASGPHSTARPGEVVAAVFLGILCLALWCALALWPARVAQDKGHSFAGYFIFSLFAFPLALVTAYLVGDRNQPARLDSPEPVEEARSAHS